MSYCISTTTCITAVNISVAGFVTSSSHLATSEPSRPYTLGTLIPGPVINYFHTLRKTIFVICVEQISRPACKSEQPLLIGVY